MKHVLKLETSLKSDGLKDSLAIDKFCRYCMSLEDERGHEENAGGISQGHCLSPRVLNVSKVKIGMKPETRPCLPECSKREADRASTS